MSRQSIIPFPWEYYNDIRLLLEELKDHGYQIVLLEQTKESCSYDMFMPSPPVCLVVGNEIEGVSEDICDFSDEAIEIEMAGIKNSLNVSVAFGIIAYHFRGCLSNKSI